MPGSLLTSIASAFGAGLAASITPCVYPLIPVTLAIFGATREVKRSRAFLLALSYVLGMATMYTALGMISALSGAILGSALRNPWLLIAISGVLILLSLYTLDIVKLDALYKVQAKAGNIGGKGFLGAFLMGTVSGVVAAPCTAPILITILGLAASTQSMFQGALLLFSYALGFGMIFLALGAFSRLAHTLPRSGDWLHMVKFFISAGILVVVLFLLKPLLKTAGEDPLMGRSMMLYASLIILALLSATIGYKRNLKVVKFFCAALLAMGVFGLFFSYSAGSSLKWETSADSALQVAAKSNRPVMIDFSAQWCPSCKEYDSVTFVDKAVQAELKKFSLARVDLTLADEMTDEIYRRYGLGGLPTIVFLCPSGAELKEARIEGFKGPQEFLSHIDLVFKQAVRC